MKLEKYKDKDAAIRDLSYEKAVREVSNEGPTNAESITIVYTPLKLLEACQKGLSNDNEQ